MFADGKESGTASNMKIETDRNGDRVIVGYGHAIYAGELDGKLYVFGTRNQGQLPGGHIGWGGYSVSTTGQLGNVQTGIRKTGRSFELVDCRPGFGFGKTFDTVKDAVENHKVVTA